MNQEKIGEFIAKLRKEKGLKQTELANKLGVTDKTVSRWETGKYMPDLSLFPIISEELGITVNDLMSGEIVDKKNIRKPLRKMLLKAFPKLIRVIETG